MLQISIKAEEVFNWFGVPITNSLLASILMTIFFALTAIIYRVKKDDGESRLVFFVRFMTGKLYHLFETVFLEKAPIFFPLAASFFLYILFSNWAGLIPGVGSILIDSRHFGEKIPLLRAATADLNTTLALALISFVLIQSYGVKYLGAVGYLRKFINLKSPVDFFSGILEIVSEFSKIISFAFRLFGNIFAGEVLIAVVAFLIPVLASFPFLVLEIFIGLIQALVFALLTSVFINMAIAKQH